MSEKRSQETSGEDSAANLEALTDQLLEQFSEITIVDLIKKPINEARLMYRMSSLNVCSENDFIVEIASYYEHVLCHTGRASTDDDPESIRQKALAIIEKGFEGGFQSACNEGLNRTHGGMLHVLDIMTDQIEKDMVEEYITTVFNKYISPMDSSDKTKLFEIFINKYSLLIRHKK